MASLVCDLASIRVVETRGVGTLSRLSAGTGPAAIAGSPPPPPHPHRLSPSAETSNRHAKLETSPEPPAAGMVQWYHC